MKTKLKKFFALILLCCPVKNFSVSAFDSFVKGEPISGRSVICDSSYDEVRKISFGNNMESVMKIKYYPEVVKSISEDGPCLYERYATVIETIYINKKNTIPTKLLEHKLKVNFTYDKKSLVRVEDPREDIDCTKRRLDQGNKRWKLAQTHEILYDEGICIVSEMFTIFKQQKLTDKIEYIENSHIDIMCTPKGTIAINSKSV